MTILKRKKDKKKYEVESGAEFSPDILMCDQSELYLTNEDIEKLNDRYEELYKKVKNNSNISEEQQKLEQHVLLEKYAFEVAQLSKKRECEYCEWLAKIEAKGSYIIPARKTHFLWLRRLFRRPTQNRAQDIIDEEADLNAEDYFRPREAENEQRAKLQELEETPEQPGTADTPADVLEQPGTAEQPVEEPKRRRRRRTSKLAAAELDEITQEVDDAQALTPPSSDTTPPGQLRGQMNIEDIK